MCSANLPRRMGFPLDISLHRAPWWVGSTVGELGKNPYGYKPKLKCPHAEFDSDNNSDQTFSPNLSYWSQQRIPQSQSCLPSLLKNPLTV